MTAVAGHVDRPGTFFMGGTGGGVWKTESYGNVWYNVSDGSFATGAIGAIDVADSDPDIVYVGTGSAAIPGVGIRGRSAAVRMGRWLRWVNIEFVSPPANGPQRAGESTVWAPPLRVLDPTAPRPSWWLANFGIGPLVSSSSYVL